MGIFKRDTFEGKNILVTGATGGIGEKVVYELMEAGANVTATGRNEEKLSTLSSQAHEINGLGRLLTVAGDLSEKEEREKIISSSYEEFGRIDGLVNSAGISGGDKVEDVAEEKLRSIMELNYFCTVLFTQELYPYLKKSESASIVNLSSLSGLRAPHSNMAYSASKFAIIAFTQSLALEAIEDNIRVNAVCPGYVNTKMARNSIERKAENAGLTFQEQFEKIESQLPSKRLTEPEEVAGTIIFLLSEAAHNIIGESVKISGGSVMR